MSDCTVVQREMAASLERRSACALASDDRALRVYWRARIYELVKGYRRIRPIVLGVTRR
jgi:hypothetical protein